MLSFVSSENAAQYVKDLENASLKQDSEPMLDSQIKMFNKKLSKNSVNDLLKNMLNFNPYFRMTAFEAL